MVDSAAEMRYCLDMKPTTTPDTDDTSSDSDAYIDALDAEEEAAEWEANQDDE